MSIESELYTTLTNDAGVTALVSTRIYPNEAPESTTFPYVVYRNIAGSRLSTIKGVGDAKRKFIQMKCHAKDSTTEDGYDIAKAVADAIEAALEGDGYFENDSDLYDSVVQAHTVFLDWSFMA